MALKVLDMTKVYNAITIKSLLNCNLALIDGIFMTFSFVFFLGSRDHEFTKVKWYLAVNCTLLLHNDTNKQLLQFIFKVCTDEKGNNLISFPFLSF